MRMVHTFYVLLIGRDSVAGIQTEMPSERERKLQVIKDYIRRERIRRDIKTLGHEYRFELGCFGVGEIFNLVECQLLLTHEGYGGWLELTHDDILDGVYEYVTKGKRGY
ncbi:MAG: hypothetical protein HYW88_01845 [Candidatus Sungbacteria bacterium]|nr:hypothetical protein [Candidatus Sungbacteria bacterium]